MHFLSVDPARQERRLSFGLVRPHRLTCSLREAIASATAQELYWLRLTLSHFFCRMDGKTQRRIQDALEQRASALGITDPLTYPWTTRTEDPRFVPQTFPEPAFAGDTCEEAA